MKLNKKYFPSLGFILLLVTISATSLCITWVFSPLSYEKALILEKKGHKYFKEEKYAKAYEYFLKSALINDKNSTISYRYRCTGTALSQQKKYKEAMNYYQKALSYNKKNKIAKAGIDWISQTNKINTNLENIKPIDIKVKK